MKTIKADQIIKIKMSMTTNTENVVTILEPYHGFQTTELLSCAIGALQPGFCLLPVSMKNEEFQSKGKLSIFRRWDLSVTRIKDDYSDWQIWTMSSLRVKERRPFIWHKFSRKPGIHWSFSRKLVFLHNPVVIWKRVGWKAHVCWSDWSLPLLKGSNMS